METDLMKQKNICRKVRKSLVMNDENRKADRMEEQEVDEREKKTRKVGSQRQRSRRELQKWR